MNNHGVGHMVHMSDSGVPSSVYQIIFNSDLFDAIDLAWWRLDSKVVIICELGYGCTINYVFVLNNPSHKWHDGSQVIGSYLII